MCAHEMRVQRVLLHLFCKRGLFLVKGLLTAHTQSRKLQQFKGSLYKQNLISGLDPVVTCKAGN